MSLYKPMLSEKEIQKRRVFQEKIYQAMKSIKRKSKIRIIGKTFLILPGVFPPFWESSFLAKAVRKETREGDYCLDMGTGTGIQAIFAAEKAEKVLAADINPAAVRCAKLNVNHHKLNKKIKVIKSDLFSNIHDKFDLIIFNPPFRWFKPHDMLERSNLDENYKTLTRFFREAKYHLKENGRMLAVFSTSGDIKHFEHLIKENNLESKILARQKRNDWEYVTYRLTYDI